VADVFQYSRAYPGNAANEVDRKYREYLMANAPYDAVFAHSLGTVIVARNLFMIPGGTLIRFFASPLWIPGWKLRGIVSDNWETQITKLSPGFRYWWSSKDLIALRPLKTIGKWRGKNTLTGHNLGEYLKVYADSLQISKEV
jgi:hypothetical protein